MQKIFIAIIILLCLTPILAVIHYKIHCVYCGKELGEKRLIDLLMTRDYCHKQCFWDNHPFPPIPETGPRR